MKETKRNIAELLTLISKRKWWKNISFAHYLTIITVGLKCWSSKNRNPRRIKAKTKSNVPSPPLNSPFPKIGSTCPWISSSEMICSKEKHNLNPINPRSSWRILKRGQRVGANWNWRSARLMKLFRTKTVSTAKLYFQIRIRKGKKL